LGQGISIQGSQTAGTATVKPFFYKAKLLKVLDGDTCDLEVDLGFKVYLKERFRLYGINTGEKFGIQKSQGMKAKEFAENWFANYPQIFVLIHKPDKYGRWLAQIYDKPEAEESLNQLLVDNHLAVEYYGEKRDMSKELEL